MTAPLLLFLVTEDWYFVSHRLPLARAAIAAGYRVVVATRVQRHGEAIRAAGCELRSLGWRRSGNSPLAHLRALRELTALYRELRPDLVHHVALKPVIFGAWAASRAGVEARVNAVAGLGYGFSASTPRARLLRPLLMRLLHYGLRGERQRTIVQNRGDQQALVGAGIVSAERVRLIRGAGVVPGAYQLADQRREPPTVLLVSRMLREKGVGEFAAAAARLRSSGSPARFVMVGAPDPDSPAAIPEPQLRAWQAAGAIEWLGQRDDVPALLADAAIFCLPTRYGEGIPRSLLEAAAAGLALIGSDTAGCREVITHEETGLLVPPGDVDALAGALARLLGDAALRARLGAAARARIAREFTQERVHAETLAVYREVLG